MVVEGSQLGLEALNHAHSLSCPRGIFQTEHLLRRRDFLPHFAGGHCFDDGSGTAAPDETDSGWVYVDIAEATANSITVDLTRSGSTIYGLRYAMEDATCCQHYAPTSDKLESDDSDLKGLLIR